MDYENMQEENEVMQLAEEAAVDENWLRDFKTGIAMGLCLSSQFESKAEPIAYLYGHVAKEGETPTHIIGGVEYVGAVLPPLPEWDREMYPWAVIGQKSDGGYYLVARPSNDVVERDGDYIYRNIQGVVFVEQSGEWVSYDGTLYLTLCWANYDVYYSGGETLYLSASEPIPIYE